ncbi:MAG: metal-dependent hydrolase [Candidatus Korobacteraceae bacterium]
MEPVTHLLTGATLARTGFNRKTALATVTMMLAAEAADLDIVAMVKGSACEFIEHRGITHTFVAIPFLAGLVVGVIWLADTLWQRSRRARGLAPAPLRRWGLLYLLACVAALSHLLLDFTNSYGLRPFFPFSRHWYAWDIVFIFEPLITAALLAALVLPWLFGLVNQEIGGRSNGPRGRGAAIAALLFIVVLWGVRDFEHRRALAAMDGVEFQGEPSIRRGAFPYMVNPFRWAGVAEISNAYVSMEVDSLRPEVDPGNRAETYYKPQPAAATDAAEKTGLGRAYLEWARFPLVEAEALGEPTPGYLVHFSDVRFMYPDSPLESYSGTDSGHHRHPLEAYVLLDSDLRMMREGFGSPTGQQERTQTAPGQVTVRRRLQAHGSGNAWLPAAEAKSGNGAPPAAGAGPKSF